MTVSTQTKLINLIDALWCSCDAKKESNTYIRSIYYFRFQPLKCIVATVKFETSREFSTIREHSMHWVFPTVLGQTIAKKKRIKLRKEFYKHQHFLSICCDRLSLNVKMLKTKNVTMNQSTSDIDFAKLRIDWYHDVY